MLRFRCLSFAAVATTSVLLLGGASAQADVTMKMKLTEDVGSESPEVSAGVARIAADRMAHRSSDDAESPANEVIFRADRELMWFVDHEDKTYRQIDRAAIEAFAAKMNEAMAKMKEQLAGLPPEQRAMLEKNLPGMMPAAAAKPAPAVEYRKTSETKSISGFDCTKYERVEDGRVDELLWVAPNAAIGLSAEDQAVFGKMSEFTQKMLSAMGPAVAAEAGDEFAAVSKLGGWPILTQDLDDQGKVEDETLVESITHEKLADSVFEVPAGYTLASDSFGDE
jgi:outer membrane murein-binding lipoprotein Lpp